MLIFTMLFMLFHAVHAFSYVLLMAMNMFCFCQIKSLTWLKKKNNTCIGLLQLIAGLYTFHIQVSGTRTFGEAQVNITVEPGTCLIDWFHLLDPWPWKQAEWPWHWRPSYGVKSILVFSTVGFVSIL